MMEDLTTGAPTTSDLSAAPAQTPTLLSGPEEKPPVVYVDGVFDLFHTGHLSFLHKARAAGGAGASLLVGIITDEDAGWKRRPFIPHVQRVEMLAACRYVDRVVKNPPLVLTEEFLDRNGITCVIHGDDDSQEKYFAVPIARGIMKYVPYERNSALAVSTSELIARIRSRPEVELRAAAPGNQEVP
jgi:cytidyltransferase-like protein